MEDPARSQVLPAFLANAIKQASKAQLASALELLLEPYFLTTFRAARTQDHEVAALRAMEALNALKQQDDEYDYMLRLRVTRAKARNLVYQVHLQQLESEAALDELVCKVMASPSIEKATSGHSQTHWVLDIPNPLVMERIRQRVRKAGFVSDGSFSPSIVKLPVNAYAAVLAELVPQNKRTNLLNQARQLAHASEKLPLKDVLGSILANGAAKLAGKAGEQLSEDLVTGLGNLLQKGDWRVLQQFWEIKE